MASVRDRVVHRLVYDYLVPLVDPKFDFDAWSCRKNKGLHACLIRTQRLLIRHKLAWIWRCDIHKFFDSVPHELLMNVVRKDVVCVRTRKLLEQIISSYHNTSYPQCKTGLPIGNLTSQLLANMYSHQFDSYVRHVIKPLAYLRYGDDFIIICNNKSFVEHARVMGSSKLAGLGLDVNEKQNTVVRSIQGLHFLGHIVNSSGESVCKKTRIRMVKRVNLRNVSGYSVMKVDDNIRRLMPWIVDI